MLPLLKRILVHGTLTAGLLAVVGFGYAELAGLWLVAKAPTRGTFDSTVASSPAEDPLAAELKYRIPATMALCGFLFVAGGEVAVHLWRRRRPPAKPPEPRVDPAEALLEQILAEVERAKATPSPSSADAENKPIAL